MCRRRTRRSAVLMVLGHQVRQLFPSQKITKTKITDVAWEKKERKNRNKNENPVVLGLLIGQEAVLPFLLTGTRITNNFMNIFSGVTSPRVISYPSVLPVGFKLNLRIKTLQCNELNRGHPTFFVAHFSKYLVAFSLMEMNFSPQVPHLRLVRYERTLILLF